MEHGELVRTALVELGAVVVALGLLCLAFLAWCSSTRWRRPMIAACLVGTLACGPVFWHAHRTLAEQRRILCHSPSVKRSLCGWPG